MRKISYIRTEVADPLESHLETMGYGYIVFSLRSEYFEKNGQEKCDYLKNVILHHSLRTASSSDDLPHPYEAEIHGNLRAKLGMPRCFPHVSV